jgi:hypothetical protein
MENRQLVEFVILDIFPLNHLIMENDLIMKIESTKTKHK